MNIANAIRKSIATAEYLSIARVEGTEIFDVIYDATMPTGLVDFELFMTEEFTLLKDYSTGQYAEVLGKLI